MSNSSIVVNAANALHFKQLGTETMKKHNHNRKQNQMHGREEKEQYEKL